MRLEESISAGLGGAGGRQNAQQGQFAMDWQVLYGLRLCEHGG